LTGGIKQQLPLLTDALSGGIVFEGCPQADPLEACAQTLQQVNGM